MKRLNTILMKHLCAVLFSLILLIACPMQLLASPAAEEEKANLSVEVDTAPLVKDDAALRTQGSANLLAEESAAFSAEEESALPTEAKSAIPTKEEILDASQESVLFAAGEDTPIDCMTMSGNNIGAQNYTYYWATPVYSSLTAVDGNLLRVQGISKQSGSDEIWVSYYDTSYNLLDRKQIPAELPLFGGFHATESGYFVVTGQENPNESDEVEVFRITKYDKNWNRIGSCGLFGANTYIPFDAGSCRMDYTGKYLVIRTAHEMYESSDGYHHQANVTILVDTDNMKVTDSFTSVMNSAYGYVSHSFNQFIKLENNKIVAVDHGDAHPRSVCLMNYPTDVTTGSFYSSRVAVTNVLPIMGSTGANATGVCIGGFEITNSSYLVAGNTVPQDDSYSASATRNIFVASVDKSTKAVTMHYLTDYASGEASPDNPQLVKTGQDQCLVLWTRSGSFFYGFVNGKGELQSPVYTADAELSDCAPIVKDGKVIWYTWKNNTERFYEIALSQPETVQFTERTYGHDYQWEKTENGIATLTCTKCGETLSGSVPTSYTAFWKNAVDTGSYWSYLPSGLKAGDSLAFYISRISYSAESDITLSQFIVETDDPKNAIVTTNNNDSTLGQILFKKAGTYTITVGPAYNPPLQRRYTITIEGPAEPVESLVLRAVPQAETVYERSVTLTATVSGGIGPLKYTFTAVGPDDADTMTIIKENSTNATCTWTPSAAGKYTLKASVTDAGDDNKVTESDVLTYTVRKGAIGMSTALAQSGTLTYGQKLSEAKVTGCTVKAMVSGKNVEGTFAFAEPDKILPAGQYSAAWIFTPENSSYETLSGTLKILVDKAPVTVEESPAAENVVYHPERTLRDVPLTGGKAVSGVGTVNEVPGSWEWAAPTEIPEVPGGNYDVIFTPADGKNYESVGVKIPLTVTKAVPYAGNVTASAITYGEPLENSQFNGFVQYSETDATEVPGSFMWAGGRYHPSVKDSGVTAFEYYFTPEDTKNYESIRGSLFVTVNKADHPENMPPAEINVAYSVEFISDSILKDYDGWHFELPAVTELVPGKTVTVKAVYSGADAFNYENVEIEIALTRSTCMHNGETEVRGAVDPTCTKSGFTGETYCLLCGEKLSSGTEVPALGHDWGEAQLTAEGTCITPAKYEYHCSRCGETRTEDGEVDPNNHTHIATEAGYPATEQEEGRTDRVYCEDCGKVLQEAEVIPKLDPTVIPVTGISLEEDFIELPATKSHALIVNVAPENATDKSVTWTSSAPSIASVDENGVVTGHRIGTAVITATANGGSVVAATTNGGSVVGNTSGSGEAFSGLNDGGAGDGELQASCTVKVLFSDVTDKSKAQFEAIYSLVDQQVIAGFKNGEYFAPNDQCTRAQVVLFLWRAAGRPNPKNSTLSFKDAADIKKLAPDYAKAIAWGNEKGIVMGFTSGANKGKFMPNDACTRAQIVLFLYRYAGMPATKATKLTFKDAAEIEKMAPAYTKAILWANETKVAGGYKVSGGYEFKPNKTCTRGECATFLYRALKLLQ